MLVKLFVLGHPGSGKSTVSRYIQSYTKQKYADYWSTSRINDYDILFDMSKHDETKRFHSTEPEHQGFIVNDPQAYNEALEKVEQEALDQAVKEEQVSYPSRKRLIVIEFARKDYQVALKNFDSDFLEDSYIIFLDADIGTCKDRVYHRVKSPMSPDDHYVHESVIMSYRDTNPKKYIESDLSADYNLPKNRIMLLNNKGSEQDFEPPINRFLDLIFDQASGNIIATNP